MSSFRNSRRKAYERRTQDPGIPQFDIQSWLKDRGKLVTRGELWDFVSRMEVGKRMRNRLSSRLRRLGRRMLNWFLHRPIDIEDPIYRPGYPTSQKRFHEQSADVPEGADRAGGAVSPPGANSR